jgi:hypothetical protein
MQQNKTYPIGIFGHPQGREQCVIGHAIGGQSIVSHVLKEFERPGTLSGASTGIWMGGEQ